ncbi:Uu.00g039530.m01.CDS01 [Anthostomella pinea]|uniref:Uu.00g039530.m01.CDS01 n=1 Tax=Anthostomella pinea TaxID=933095 RepID=A0AAI8VB01_9PEZI|nr:Uu.00g039530.m01.CDS01 [Anthostomella pinea]
MASEQGPVATEAPSFPSTALQPSISQAPVSVESLTAEAARATQSLKRQREATPTSPSSVLPPPLYRETSPTKAARTAGLTSRHSPAPMTAAAAIEENRRRDEEQYRLQVSGASENPAYRAQTALMSANALAMSRPQDVPPAGDVQPDAPQPDSIPMHNIGESDPKPDVSPLSATSMASLGSSGVPVATSPAPMDLDGRNNQPGFGAQPPAQMEEKGAISLSYPGILPPAPNMPAPPARGMSMPMTPNAQTPRSPNSKKHRCPYCETEFTRHHNLKSHLLTHSQEKPYVCQTCQMRFRRLHDLKRHSKLHTGEKPHICTKCDRKFARGDALARHAKGPGGCVGRRSSLGSYLGEDDTEGASHMEGDDSTMTGVVYDGTASEVDMTEEERRRLSSVPSIKAQHVQGNDTLPNTFTMQLPTHPLPDASAGRLFPPNVERGSASSNPSHTPGTSISSIPMVGNPSMYAQSAMTESPKPLSPSALPGHDAANLNRQRSPSLTTQFQQQHFGRHQSDRNAPLGSYTHEFDITAWLFTETALVHGFTAADAAKYAASAASAQGTAPTSQSESGSSNQQQMAPAAPVGHTRTPSGPGQNGGSGDSSSNNIFATDHGIWAYIHSLEEQVRQLNERVQAMEATKQDQDERIAYLTNEVTNMRSQVDTRTEATERIG